MIVRRFLHWAQDASPQQRAQGVSALARAYLGTKLDRESRTDAERVLTQFLDDPSPQVRRAMAEAFARASNAPHHIVLALADDQSDIASIVLGRSPILSDSELIDCAAIGDAFAQSAIALRPSLSVAVAAALAEVGAREALISLCVNTSVDLPEFSMRRMVERFGFDGEMREALLGRRNLPGPLRADLVGAAANALGEFVTSCDWLSPERAQRLIREARDQAHVIIAATTHSASAGPMQLVVHLRASGQLTASLLLRALLSGNRGLFEAALAHLAGVPETRVGGLMRDWRSAGFAALYRKAGLAEALLPAFRAAIDALDAPEFAHEAGARLCRQKVERVLTACRAMQSTELDRLLAVLRRFEAEAAREEARIFSTKLKPRPRPRPQPVFSEPPLLLTDEPESEARAQAAEPLTIEMDALASELAAA
ncbi:MAG TPA: DUF2336 domain-containing protein [Methylovirgula sp.]|jgi:uncharacterized protein (DUF2336 family)